jgi:hypothetical protein
MSRILRREELQAEIVADVAAVAVVSQATREVCTHG